MPVWGVVLTMNSSRGRLRGSGGLLLRVMSDCQHVEWTDSGLVATMWRLRRFLVCGVQVHGWRSGSEMVWTRARRVPMHHAAALRWVGARPDDRAVEKGGPDAWATAGPRYDPLLAPRRDGVEFVGSSGKTNCWGASTSAKSERDGDGV